MGINVVNTIRFEKGTVDFSPIYYKITHLKPQPKLIVTALAHAGLRPVTQWAQNRVPALMAGVNAQATDSAFWKATNGATEGVISMNSGSARGVATTGKTPAFYKTYVNRFHAEPPFSAYTT